MKTKDIDIQFTNKERAQRARSSLVAYAVIYDPKGHLSTEELLADLLCDLLHLSNAEGFLARESIRSALNNYNAEQAEENSETIDELFL